MRKFLPVLGLLALSGLAMAGDAIGPTEKQAKFDRRP